MVEIHVSSLGVDHCSQLQSTRPGSNLYFEVYTTRTFSLVTFRLRAVRAPPQVLFKMDNEGHGQEIQLRNLAANTPLSLCNWKNSMVM